MVAVFGASRLTVEPTEQSEVIDGSSSETRTQAQAPIVLTVVAAVGSLGVGATVGAVAAHSLRERAERAQRNRERDALLCLIGYEIEANKQLFVWIIARIEGQAPTPLIHLRQGIRVETWNNGSVRIAQLLEAPYLAPLTRYYFQVQGTLSQSIYLESLYQYINDIPDVTEQLRSNIDLGAAAKSAIQGYLPDVT